jgi:hypothetical protein
MVDGFRLWDAQWVLIEPFMPTNRPFPLSVKRRRS